MIFNDYFLSLSLAKEMDEKRAAAMTFPPQSTKDDQHLYGNSTNLGSVSSSTILPGTETQQPTSFIDGQWSQTQLGDKEEQYDFVPHFQRVSIGGEHSSGVIINYKYRLIYYIFYY